RVEGCVGKPGFDRVMMLGGRQMFGSARRVSGRLVAAASVPRISAPLRATMLCLLALAAPSSFAAEDKVISVTSEGAGVFLDVRNAPRREVVEHLLGHEGIKVEWLNSTIADERISGTYRGPAFAIVRQLLTEIDFAVAYDANDDPRISRVVISGRSG